MTPARRRVLPLLLLTIALLAAACSDGGSGTMDGPSSTAPRSDGGPSTSADPDVAVDDVPRIEVLSSQPDRVTGDDARIRITPSSTGHTEDLVVELDGTDVGHLLEAVDGALEGVLRGLVEGTNSLTVSGDGEPLTLRLRAWPRQGPMFSGPQTPLAVCSTEDHGLGPADPDCAAGPVVLHRHLTADGELVDLPDPTDPPDDIHEIEIDGERFPAIVRTERGVINRSLYEFSLLVTDPSTDPDAPVHPAGDRALVLRFDDGCGTTYGQGRLAPSTDHIALLGSGHTVATATFLDGSTTCNDVVTAETATMVKERFIEAVGIPAHTIGLGRGLGGGRVHLLAQTYPDVLDGGVTVAGFPDVVSVANDIADCRLLDAWFRGGGEDLDRSQRLAITGHASPDTCDEIIDRWGDPFDPRTGCDPALDDEERFGPGRPRGLRCTMQDGSAVPFGDDPLTGTVTRPLDNVGVQYGLDALWDGAISMTEFLDLNDRIGGLGPDSELTGERMEVGDQAIEHLYETGRISEGAGHQGRIPFLDLVPRDPAEPGDLHRALAFRDRVEQIGGRRALQQIWLLDRIDETAIHDAVLALEDWLGVDDPADDPVPEAAHARCDRDDADPLVGPDVFRNPGSDCLEDDPPTDPRIVAGAWTTGDIVKCSLRPVDPLDYPDPPTEDERRRLHRIFPDGVCDWSTSGVGQMLPGSPDRSYDEIETPADLA